MKRRIPSLDGIRALAIAVVILLHLHERYPATRLGKLLLMLTFDGVGLFFVLSGFLITRLLLDEHQAKGTISLRDFYLRRTLRILPPLYAYLLFVAVFCRAAHIPVALRSLVSAALFYQNYDPSAVTWLTEHTWSLCVEEQFYLLWPITLLLVLRRGGKKGAIGVAATLIAITPVLRIAASFSPGLLIHHRESYLLFTRMDALMSGCLLALLADEPRFERFFARVTRIWWLLPLFFYAISGLLTLRFGAAYRYSLGMTLESLTMALFLLWAARHQHSWVGRVLNSRPIVAAGVLSYSAYLWQTFFIHGSNPTAASRMPWALASIWVAAWLSYTCVEQPALRLRRYLEKRSAMPLLEENEPARILL